MIRATAILAQLLVALSLPCAAQAPPNTAAQAAQSRAEEFALREIDDYCIAMNAADPRYKEIEKKILPFLPDLMRQFSPHQWLPVIKLLYQVRSIPQ